MMNRIVHLTEDLSFDRLFSGRTPGGSDFLGLYRKEHWVSHFKKPLMEFVQRVYANNIRVLCLFSILSDHLNKDKGISEQLTSHNLLTPAPSLLPGPGSCLATPIPSSYSNSLIPFNRPSPIPAPQE